MPVLIFIMMYITGVMLGFAENSNFRGFLVNPFWRMLMFMKLRRRIFYIHALIFQAVNLLLFVSFVTVYFLMNEKTVGAVYNIYKGASLLLFIIIIIATMVDAIILEKNGKGIKDENNRY